MHRRMQKNKHMQGNDLDTPTIVVVTLIGRFVQRAPCCAHRCGRNSTGAISSHPNSLTTSTTQKPPPKIFVEVLTGIFHWSSAVSRIDLLAMI